MFPTWLCPVCGPRTAKDWGIFGERIRDCRAWTHRLLYALRGF